MSTAPIPTLFAYPDALAVPQRDGSLGWVPHAIRGLLSLYAVQPQLELVFLGKEPVPPLRQFLDSQDVPYAYWPELPEQLPSPHWLLVPDADSPDLGLPVCETTDVGIWAELRGKLLAAPRVASVHRKTSETDIRIDLNLDGTGQASIHTGLGFFDHMLDQLARHGGVDLAIAVQGDLHIDEHHTIEDTALALGEAFAQALGNKQGVARYGFLLPMDESLAQVAIDFSGRPWLVWQAEFRREKIGDMPTELFFHFFKSFCDTAKCNLNIQVQGDNEHHKIEAIFKGWAKAIRMAVMRDPRLQGIIPSTKGTL